MVVTNALGVAFTAALLSASDAGATFVFPEDGATNTLAWTRLAPASQEAVVAATGFAPVPPELAATYRQAKASLLRISDMEAEKRIEPSLAARRRANVLSAFARRCREQGLSETQTSLLLRRLH